MKNVEFEITIHCDNGADLVSLFPKSDTVVHIEDKSTIKLLDNSKSLGLGEHADIIKLLITLPINTTAVVIGNLIFSKLKAKNKEAITVVIDDTFFDNAERLSQHITDEISKKKE